MSNNFFSTVATNANKLQEDFLGPNYNYAKFIKNPTENNMSDRGNMSAITNNIRGIVGYVQILISGTGNAKKGDPKTPLGNQFFLKTGGKCKDYKSGKIVDRSMYVNNIPSKNVPLLSNISGMQFKEFRGLVPGIFHNMYAINPVKIFGAFMQGNEPLCANITLNHIDSSGRTNKKSGYVPINELLDLMNNDEIPKNNKRQLEQASITRETFVNLCNSCNNYNAEDIDRINIDMNSSSLDNDLNISTNLFSNMYISSLSLLILYILYKFIKNNS